MAIQSGTSEFNTNSMGKKSTRPSAGFNKISTPDVDMNEDLNKLSTEAAGFASEASSVAQKLIGEVKAQGEVVLDRVSSLAKEYGLELNSMRTYVSQTTQRNPIAVVLGAAAIGFCAGYLAKGRMQKPSAE